MLKDRLGQEIERSKRSGDRFAVLFLDLDRLKELNDQYGHAAGDEALKAVAAEVAAASAPPTWRPGTGATSSW